MVIKGGLTHTVLRASLVTSSFEEGHVESSVSKRTGHRLVESLRRYHHLRSNIGLQQQRDILGEPEKKKARTDNVPGPIIDHICPDIGTVPSFLFSNVDSERYDTNADLN